MSSSNYDKEVQDEEGNVIDLSTAIKQSQESPSNLQFKEKKEPVSIDTVIRDFQNSAFDTLNVFTVVAFTFFISHLYRNIIQPFVERVSLQHTYSVAEEARIESILAQLMAITKSDRVILFEFHNGDKTKGGRHLNKVSATQEITGPGITRVCSKYQRILISNLHALFAKLEQTNYLKTDVDLIKEAYCQSQFIENGVEFCITKGYFELGVPLAIVQIQYCRNQREGFDQFNSKEIERLISELSFLIKRDKETWLGEMFKLFSRRIV